MNKGGFNNINIIFSTRSRKNKIKVRNQLEIHYEIH